MIRIIVKDVAKGTYPSYNRSFNGTWIYEIFQGQKEVLTHDKTMPGVTVQFQNRYDPASTIVYCPNIEDAIEIVEYQEKHRDAIHRSQERLANYIREHKMY